MKGMGDNISIEIDTEDIKAFVPSDIGPHGVECLMVVLKNGVEIKVAKGLRFELFSDVLSINS